jgi:hypothetical protein
MEPTTNHGLRASAPVPTPDPAQPAHPAVPAATPAYEAPRLTLEGNLHNVLGKSGDRPDYLYRRPTAGRP